MSLREVSKKFEDKLKKLKVFVVDVDGILTNGQLYWMGEEVGFARFFHAQDGYGLKTLKRFGLKVGFISGGDSIGVVKRAESLGLDYVFLGNEDKTGAFQQILDDGYKKEEIGYMGDEFFDIPLLEMAGFGATVENSSLEVQESADYVCKRAGGMGCVREVVDLIRYAQGIDPRTYDHSNSKST